MLCNSKKESEEASIWTNFDSFAIKYLSRLLQKFHFPIEVVLNSGPGNSFQAAVFVEFRDEMISFGMMTYTGQISLTDCIYFPRYSAKCISHFMHRHLMMS